MTVQQLINKLEELDEPDLYVVLEDSEGHNYDARGLFLLDEPSSGVEYIKWNGPVICIR